MDPNQFVTPEAMYAQQAAQASGGAMPATGMAPYPLYGIPPLGQAVPGAPAATAEVPFYRRNWFWALVGAGAIGAAWAYFGRGGRGVSSNRAGGDWSQTPQGFWEKRQGDESVLRVFNDDDGYFWIADYHPQGARYRAKTGSAKSLDSAKVEAERWMRRASVGGV